KPSACLHAGSSFPSGDPPYAPVSETGTTSVHQLLKEFRASGGAACGFAGSRRRLRDYDGRGSSAPATVYPSDGRQLGIRSAHSIGSAPDGGARPPAQAGCVGLVLYAALPPE